MKPGVKEAIRIAGSSQHEFDREMNSCRFTAQQIIDACGLRAALLAKQSLGARLSDPDYQPAIIEKREEDTPVETSVTKSQRVADWRRALDRDAAELAARENITKAAAVDRIVTVQHRLGKLDREHQLAKLGGGSLPTPGPGRMLTEFNPPGDQNSVLSPDEVLNMIARQLQDASPGMSAAKAKLRAAEDARFTKVYREDRERRMLKATALYG